MDEESNKQIAAQAAKIAELQAKLKDARMGAATSAMQYSAVLETVGEAILVTDEAGKIVMLNKQVEKTWGYTQEELIGKPVDMLMPESYRARHAAGMARNAGGGPPAILDRRVEMEGLRKDGTAFPLEIVISKTRVGARQYYTASLRDITLRRQYEESLKQARDEAIEASRAKSEFLANMSHEIRTPLNGIIGMTDLLFDGEQTADQRDYTESIRNCGDSLLSILNDVLDFSKIESEKMDLADHPFELIECLESAFDVVASRIAQKGLELSYDIADDMPPVIGADSARLKQILVNLLTNAIKFTDHGEVSVRVASTPISEYFHEIQFSVRDTGIGIPEEQLAKLFQAFSQVDSSATRRFGGTGLGLVICRRLTEMMGGTIWVESVAGEGTTFHFTIKAEVVDNWMLVDDARGVHSEFTGKRIWIIEPNESMRRTIARYCRFWGADVDELDGAPDVLWKIDAGETADVLLMDSKLDGTDPILAVTSIHELIPAEKLPVLMLTWPSEGIKRAGGTALGIFAFISKPFKRGRLFSGLLEAFNPDARRAETATAPGRIPYVADQHPLRILLAEDTLVNQKVAVNILNRMGYRVAVANNGLECLDKLAAEPFDVVLMDIMMPQMDGMAASREICRRLAEGRRPRIIAMTASTTRGDREKCFDAGMSDYITKPFKIDDLIRALKAAVPLDREAAQRSIYPKPGGESFPSPQPSPQRGEGENFTSGDQRTALASAGTGASTGGAGTVSAIDAAVLIEFKQMLGGDDGLFKEMIRDYLAETPKLMVELEEYVAARDAGRVQRSAHSIKSTSAQVGAMGLSETAKTMELKGKENNLDGIEDLRDQARKQFNQAESELSDIVK